MSCEDGAFVCSGCGTELVLPYLCGKCQLVFCSSTGCFFYEDDYHKCEVLLMSDKPKTEVPQLEKISYGHPAIDEIMQWFEYKQLPLHLQEVSRPFGELAHDMVVNRGLQGPELVAGLRKLLEGKDCIVRAAIARARAEDRAANNQPENEG